jgi:hypothetical protein
LKNVYTITVLELDLLCDVTNVGEGGELKGNPESSEIKAVTGAKAEDVSLYCGKKSFYGLRRASSDNKKQRSQNKFQDKHHAKNVNIIVYE